MVKALSSAFGRKLPSAGSLLVGILVGLLFATVRTRDTVFNPALISSYYGAEVAK